LPKSKEPLDSKPAAVTSTPTPARTTTTTKKTKTAALDVATWQQLLASIKAKHNTLYSVLRMAKPVVDGSTVVLQFGFAFHHKQVNQAGSLQAIQLALNTITGDDLTVASQLVTKDTSAAPTIITTDSDSIQQQGKAPLANSLQSISSVFGGAELL
jgi:hypothetical protein